MLSEWIVYKYCFGQRSEVLFRLLDAADFVLSKFNAKERTTLERLQHVAEVCIEDFIYGNLIPMTYSAEA